MIYQDEERREIGIRSQEVAIGLGYADGVTIARLCAPDSDESLLGEPCPWVIQITIGGVPLDPSALTTVAAELESTPGGDMVSVSFEQVHAEAKIKGRISLFDRRDEPLEFIVQLSVDWIAGVPLEMALSCPFLGAAARHPNYYRPGHALGESGPANFHRLGFLEFPPPTLHDEATGWGVGFAFFAEFPVHPANSNRSIWQAFGSEDPGSHEILVRPVSQLSDFMSMRLLTSAHGRAGVFEAWKREVRKRYDLRRYDLPGPEWCQHTYLHHFTYAYGKEIYDYDRRRVDVERLLDDGEEFGGYDAIIFWNQYPRLGVDQRTQWELFDDLPEGCETLRKMVLSCHDRGVRFFLPFKPWDVRSFESLDDQARQVESLIEQTGVDGFFLDTMTTIPESFADLIRDRFPELMFCSEGRPITVREIEQLTGSWGQIPFPVSVEVDMFRFLFPEHPTNMVSRRSVGTDKDRLIKRAVFNGCGLVIWQDIFGEWLPFSKEQKRVIRSWKGVLAEYHDAVFGQRCVPLLDTLVPGIIANRFASAPKEQQLIAVYNSTDRTIDGPILHVPEISSAVCTAVWGDGGEIEVEASDLTGTETALRGARIHSTIGPKEVVAMVVIAQ